MTDAVDIGFPLLSPRNQYFAAYREAARPVIDRGHAAGVDPEGIIDNVLAALADLAAVETPAPAGDAGIPEQKG